MIDPRPHIHFPVEQAIGSSPVVPLPDEYYVVRLASRPYSGDWLAIVDDGVEVTAVRPAESSEPSEDAKGPFRALRLEIVTPFETPGFIAAATSALAKEEINVLVLSTYSFDYVLVEAGQFDQALVTLGARGFPAVR